jgi:hypothetical protein
MPKPAKPKNWSFSKWTSPKTRPVTTMERAGPWAEPLEPAEQSAEEQAAEEELLHDRTAHADKDSEHHEAGGVVLRRREELLGGVTELRIEVVHERLQRQLEQGDEQVLRGDPDDNPEGDVGPRTNPPAVGIRQAPPAGGRGARRRGAG